MPAGDITLATPKTIGTVTFSDMRYDAVNDRLEVAYVDGIGRRYEVTVRNGKCFGFNFATGAKVEVTVADSLTRALTAIFKAGARSAFTNQMLADGIVVAPGTVG